MTMLAISGQIVKGRALSRIEEIILHEREADKLESSASDHRWEAARLISEELEGPPKKTQQKLADEIGAGRRHVGYMAKTWDVFGNYSSKDRPSFWAAYNSPEVRGTAKGHKADELHIPSIEEFAEAIAANDQLEQIVLRSMERASAIRQEQLDNDPQHKKNQKSRAKQRVHDLFADIRKGVNKLISTYSPDDRAEAERVASSLEDAAQLIRTRIIGME